LGAAAAASFSAAAAAAAAAAAPDKKGVAATAVGDAVGQAQGVEEDIYPDLTCKDTQHVEWQEIKGLTAQWFGSWSSGVVAKNKAQLEGLMDLFTKRLQNLHDKVDECGMGRLCMTLLAISAGQPGSSLKAAPALHSPLLTILLDVPWSIVMRSGWPLFGLLAQLQRQHHRTDDLPTAGPTAVYLHQLNAALLAQQPEVVSELGIGFVRLQEQGSVPPTVMPALCALASQLLSSGVFDGQARIDEALRHMQGYFREAVNSIDDLQSTVESVWPLYGVLNAAAIQLAPLPSIR